MRSKLVAAFAVVLTMLVLVPVAGAVIYKVKVKAIYENYGVVPTTQRVTDRDSDLNAAATAAAGLTHYTAAASEEFLTPFDWRVQNPYLRYGFGWVGVQWLTVRGDGASIGNALFTRLSTRSLQDGSYIEVYEHLRDTGNPYATGAMVYSRAWPRATSVDVG